MGNHIHASQQQPCSYLSIGVQYWLTLYKVLLHVLVNFFQCLDLEVVKRNIVQPDGRTTFATYSSRAYWKFSLHRCTSLQEEKWQCIYKLCTHRRRSSDTHLHRVSFEVNGEFYFTSLLLGFPRRLILACKPILLTVCNELTRTSANLPLPGQSVKHCPGIDTGRDKIG